MLDFFQHVVPLDAKEKKLGACMQNAKCRGETTLQECAWGNLSPLNLVRRTAQSRTSKERPTHAPETTYVTVTSRNPIQQLVRRFFSPTTGYLPVGEKTNISTRTPWNFPVHPTAIKVVMKRKKNNGTGWYARFFPGEIPASHFRSTLLPTWCVRLKIQTKTNSAGYSSLKRREDERKKKFSTRDQKRSSSPFRRLVRHSLL